MASFGYGIGYDAGKTLGFTNSVILILIGLGVGLVWAIVIVVKALCHYARNKNSDN